MHGYIKFLIIFLTFFYSVGMTYAITHYVSEYEYGNGGSGGAAVQLQIQHDVDTLDDDWRDLFLSGSVFDTYTFSGDLAGGILGNYGTTYFDMAYSGATIRVERIIDDNTSPTGSVCATNTNPQIFFDSDMQDSAPKPFSLLNGGYRNEPAGCSNSQRNGILFTFPSEIDGFGVWLGDVESRSDGSGTVAEVVYISSTGTIVSSETIGPAVGVDQSLCGGSNPSSSPSACGNETTRFVGFRNDSNQDIKYMKIVVGDDDDNGDAGTTDGNTEHLSFVGPILAFEPDIPDLGVVKTSDKNQIMSGDMLGYTIAVTNHGPGEAKNVLIQELYPNGFDLISSSLASFSGNNLRNIGSIGSGSTYVLQLTGTLSGDPGIYTNTVQISADQEIGPISNMSSVDINIVCDAMFGDICTGLSNTCGAVLTGIVLCDGTCDAQQAPEPSILGDTCDTGLGECMQQGVIVCDPSGTGTICNAVAGIPSAHDSICDGLDNDCDGSIDEDYISLETNCGLGVCAATGTTMCSNGIETDSCIVGIGSLDDSICDGLDNDCDGDIDEEYIDVVSNCGIGACQSIGTLSCIQGGVVDSCMAGSQGDDSVCNGIDDDCDGLIDEDFIETESQCGVGECSSTGVQTCQNGVVVNSCTAGLPLSDDSICDGLDNDCDGSIDEDFVGSSLTCGVGECFSSITTQCVNGSESGSCVAGTPGVEVCDGLDNNCDMVVDEGLVCEPTYIGNPRTGGDNYCGDGIVRNGEECDDGNAIVGDGCDMSCRIESNKQNIVENVQKILDDNEKIIDTYIKEKSNDIQSIQLEKNEIGIIPLSLPVALPSVLPMTGVSI